MNLKKQFGIRIKELRLQKNLSQESLANMADLDRTYIPSIEKGNRNVSIEVAHKLSQAFNLKIHELLKGIDE